MKTAKELRLGDFDSFSKPHGEGIIRLNLWRKSSICGIPTDYVVNSFTGARLLVRGKFTRLKDAQREFRIQKRQIQQGKLY